jgi:hypothetical protein
MVPIDNPLTNNIDPKDELRVRHKIYQFITLGKNLGFWYYLDFSPKMKPTA